MCSEAASSLKASSALIILEAICDVQEDITQVICNLHRSHLRSSFALFCRRSEKFRLVQQLGNYVSKRRHLTCSSCRRGEKRRANEISLLLRCVIFEATMASRNGFKEHIRNPQTKIETKIFCFAFIFVSFRVQRREIERWVKGHFSIYFY